MAGGHDMSSFKVEKLNGDNYHSWKFNMKMYLIGKDLWEVVNGNETLEMLVNNRANNDTQNKFKKKVNQALAIISLSVSSSIQIYVRGAESGKEAWDLLQNHFEEKTLSKKIFYRRKLYSLRMIKGADIVAHINNVKTIAEHLQAVEDPVTDKDLTMILISSLPDDYNNLITSLETLDETKLTFVYVRDRVIAEAERKKGDCKPTSQGDALFTKNSHHKKSHTHKKTPKGQKTVYTCHFCKEPGHFIRDCPKRKKKDDTEDASYVNELAVNNREAECFEEFALQVGDKDDLTYWWLDSGCSQHMTPVKSDILNFKKFDTPVNINLADESVVSSCGSGDVKVKLFDGSNPVVMVFKDVLYVPQLRRKLLSITSMTNKGAKVQFEDNCCTLFLNGKKLLFGRKHGKLWRLNTVDDSCLFSITDIDSLKLWHLRLGHLNFNDVKCLSKDNMVSGIKLKPSEKMEVCEGCVMGKQKRDPFPKKSCTKTTEPLQLVHSDVGGGMQVNSVGGSRYYVTFVDDYSRFVTIYVIKHKDEVTRCFQDFIAMAENLTGKRLKRLRSDNGGEYISSELDLILKQRGILRNATIPYTPQQNGVAERMNRTLMESCRSMLHHAGLPLRFWAEALATAAYVRNRSPTSCLDKITPYELWHKEKPDVSHLRVFGCDILVHVPEQKRRKLDKKSSKCIFVGYPSGSKGYKIFDPVTRRMTSSRDVIFCESDFQCGNREVTDVPVLAEGTPNTNVYLDDVDNDNDVLDVNDPAEAVVPPVLHEVVEPDNGVLGDIERPRRQRNAPERFGDWEYASVAVSEDNDPLSFVEAMRCHNADQWKNAADEEMCSLMKNNTWELTDLPKGKSTVGCKWVLKTKRNADGSVSRYKARLVAQGFSQKYGVDYDEVFAPVVKYSSIRGLLALANQYDMEIHQMDVKSAYLNSEIDTEIFMKQPVGYVDPERPDLVCRLNKSLYGLKQSARCWNSVFDEYLKADGYTQSTADPCIYVKDVMQNGKKILMLIALYVDDTILSCNDSDFLKAEKLKLSSRFEMEDQGEINYLLGMSINRDRKAKALTIDQKLYLEGVLKRFGMSDCKPVSTPMENGRQFTKTPDDEKGVNVTEYQAVIGSLLYASVATRPDIAASVGVLSKFAIKPSNDHWIGVKRILRYIRGTLDYGLRFVHSDDFSLLGYSDSDWAGDKDSRKSTSGYIFRLGGSPISWRSTKQSVVALSTTEAEYIALSQAAQEAVWLRYLFTDMKLRICKPTVLFEDNESAIALSKNPRCHSRMKHVDIKYHYIRDVIKQKVVEVKSCSTHDMVADIFTKGLAKPPFEKLRELMGVCVVK